MSEEQMYYHKGEAEELLSFNLEHWLNQVKLIVEDGWVNASDAYLKLYNAEKQISEIKALILDKAVQEVGEYPKGREIAGFKLEKINAAGRWNYSKVEPWNTKKEELKELETKLQQSYRAWEKGIEMFDNETGEKIPVPAYISGKETIKVTKSK